MDSQELLDKDKIVIQVMLLGESQVGKTSIVNSYIGESFQENIRPTVGIGFAQKHIHVGNGTVFLNIWDGSGQEKYRSMQRVFMKNINVFIFVYDITNKKSFDELKNWKIEAQDIGRKFTNIIIFGNKSDLYIDEKVTEEEARNFADEIGAKFFLVSAKNNYNIENGFEYLIKQILDPNYVEIIEEEEETKSIYIRKQEKPRRNYICCGFNSRESL